MILAYRHTGVNVTDLDRAVTFYHGLLGLDIIERRHEEGPYIDALTGLKAVRLDWVKVGAPNGVLLELVQFHSHVAATVWDESGIRVLPNYATLGCNHLCFRVADVEALREKLVAAGVPCHPVQTDPPGRVKNFACYDPDGTIVELVEVL